MVLFSTHDVTLGSVLTYMKNALGTPTYYTPFASALFIELTTSTTTPSSAADFLITVNYNDNILISNIPYLDFKTKMMKYYMTQLQIHSYCTGTPIFVAYAYQNATTALAILSAILALILTFVLVFYCCINKKVDDANRPLVGSESRAI